MIDYRSGLNELHEKTLKKRIAEMEAENNLIRKEFEDHRRKSIICCDETCLCWKIEHIIDGGCHEYD